MSPLFVFVRMLIRSCRVQPLLIRRAIRKALIAFRDVVLLGKQVALNLSVLQQLEVSFCRIRLAIVSPISS